MKTTIEIPDAIVREVKLRALHEGRKLKDVVADLLRRGLDAPITHPSEGPSLAFDRDERSGLPVVRCRHTVRRKQNLMTPDRVAEILLTQEAEWHSDADSGR